MTAGNGVPGPAFVRAVVAAPGDITPRLVYADWLQEQGLDELADFTREAFGAGPPGLSSRTREYRRRLALVRGMLGVPVPKSHYLYLADHPQLRAGQTLNEETGGTCWVPRHPDVAVVVRYGFISEVGCPHRWFLRAAPRLFARHPVRDVRLWAHPDDNVYRPDGGPLRDWWPSRWSGCGGGIDARLFSLLPGGELHRLRIPRGNPQAYREHRAYPDAAAAHAALSAACVAYGRAAAGVAGRGVTA
jgi:uncharacterized protein (TIGR02996 family)